MPTWHPVPGGEGGGVNEGRDDMRRPGPLPFLKPGVPRKQEVTEKQYACLVWIQTLNEGNVMVWGMGLWYYTVVVP